MLDHYSFSSLSTLSKCARAFKYSYVDCLEPLRESVNLKAGSAMHRVEQVRIVSDKYAALYEIVADLRCRAVVGQWMVYTTDDDWHYFCDRLEALTKEGD